MRRRFSNVLLVPFALAAGCGFESRVEGTWQPVGLAPQALVDRKVPRPMAKTLASASFVAEDGAVYVGAKHEQAILAHYQVLTEEDDCATVRLDPPDANGPKQGEEVQACLDDDQLTLRHDAKGNVLEVTFRRAP